ncbi:unnamed protein product [Eruca vesicaria subsp. sativa]|uniref:Uncharacterized protein n=1 Tax=Eruca vesicaria subsp. sativa TaxID=29727 RepID=A0ABC8K830_ERUVS|nr:unnamed protein product [Eruca vesicaria subsp. sativa]
MEKKREICEYRERLDKTLASPELTNEQTLKTLIRNQLNQEECNVDILDKRVADLSSILEKLRSVSTEDQDLSRSTNEASSGDWKVKHDHEDCRVMYREGFDGSPFHTLLVEGYMDGPIQDCKRKVMVSMFFRWPNSVFPAFRILQTKCLQKFRINEQICLVRSVAFYFLEANLNLDILMILFFVEERVKVPWPMTNREAIVQFFLFEYFKDGLAIILLNSVKPSESIGISEEAVNAVRIDLVGGVAIQKVSPERSYLRYIAEFDLKLDLIPPSLINFMSRQLLGNGFRLFKKTIGSVAKSEDYIRVLEDPLYTRIREAMCSTDNTDENFQASELARPLRGNVHEIEEEECDDDDNEEEDKSVTSYSSSEEEENFIGKKIQNNNGKTLFCVSPEVKQALGTLERVMSMVRKSRTDRNTSTSSEEEEEGSSSSTKQHSESIAIVSSSKVCIQDPKTEVLDYHNYKNSNSNRGGGSSSFAASPKMDLTTNSEQVTRITISQATTLFSQTEDNKSDDKPSGFSGGKSSVMQRKHRPSCFGIRSWMRRT